jgi:hypothetical protein
MKFTNRDTLSQLQLRPHCQSATARTASSWEMHHVTSKRARRLAGTSSPLPQAPPLPQAFSARVQTR